MPALQPAVRPSFSPPSKDPFPYSTTSMMNSLDRVTSSKKGASTSKNNMYSSNAMTLKEHPLLQSSSTKLSTSQSASPPKPKKATPRPTTPHGNNNNGQKNFVERNKQLASSPKAATAAPVKLTPTKSLSPPVSPQPTLKRTAAQSSRPIAEKPSGTSKKSTDVPTTVQKSAAHTRAHAAVPRATSPDASLLENLIRENKKLKELLGERSEELREAENDIEEFQEVIEALQERVKQVEARNRELQTENDILRKKVVENAVKEQATAAAQSPSNILSAIMNNQKKIRGEETSEPVPVIAPIVKIPPIIPTTALITPPAIDSTPAPQTSALSNLLLASKSNVSKVNDATVVEPEALVQSSRNLTPATTPAENPQQPRYHPAMMQKLGRAEPSAPKNEMLDRHVEMVRDREAANKAKAAAALNAVMEESDESEGEDEYLFGHDEDIPDIQTFSDTSSSPDEDCENELIKTDFRLAPINGSHACAAIEEEDEEEDEATEIQKVAPLPEYIQKLKSTNLNDIPEDDEDEDDEFDLPPNLLNNPKQHLDQISTAAMKSSIAPSQTKKSTHRRLRRYSSANSSNSDSGIGSVQTSPQTSNSGQTTFDITSQSINHNVTNASQKFADSFSVNGYSQKFQNFADDNDEKQDNLHRGSITSTYSDDSDTPSHSSTSTTHSSQSSNSSACGSFQPFTSCTDNNAQQTSDKHYRRSSNQETPLNDICSQFGENANVYSQQNDLINENLEYGNQGYYSRQSVTNSQRSNNVNNDYPNNEQRSQSTSSRRQSSASEHSMPPVSRQPSPTQSVSSRSSKVNDYIRAQSPANSSRSSTPMSDYNPKVNQSSNNSSRASTPSYPVRARAPSPPSSTRTSTPVSESSRNASTRQMNYGQIPSPPPPPAAKDAFTTLQHYLRLLSENCSIGNPLNYYDVKAPLDEGSSAQVFSAVSRATKHEFAIKVIPLTYSLEFIFNELYVLRNLKHKNVVEFKESFLRWDGKTREIWIVMEKCARGDVTSRAGKVTQKEVARITREILTSLSHLHAHGIIHRDIKLSNILMTATNEVKIADFGISSLTPTSTTGMVGTIPYMAPDVVNVGSERPYSSKVDIWSLGVCVLELLTGKAAWGRIRDDEIMMRLRRGEKPYGFERLRSRSADFSWEASDFLERCFARDGEVRYSAEELLQHPFIKNNCTGSRPTQSPQI